MKNLEKNYPNNELLILWHQFSQKSSKYNVEECEQLWISYKEKNEGAKLTVSSLYYWAQQDSPNEYKLEFPVNKPNLNIVKKMEQYSPHTDYYFEDFITEYNNKIFEEKTRNKTIQQAKNEMLPKLGQVMRIICVGSQPMLLYKESKSYPFKIGKYTAGKYGGYIFYLKSVYTFSYTIELKQSNDWYFPDFEFLKNSKQCKTLVFDKN